jgi:hypothetical protein
MKKIFWFCLPDFFWSWCRENRIIKFCQMLKKKTKKKESTWYLHTFLCCWWTKKNPWQCFVNRSVCSWGRGLRSIPFLAIYIHWPSSPYNQRKNKVQKAKFTTGRRCPKHMMSSSKTHFYFFRFQQKADRSQTQDHWELLTQDPKRREKRGS